MAYCHSPFTHAFHFKLLALVCLNLLQFIKVNVMWKLVCNHEPKDWNKIVNIQA